MNTRWAWYDGYSHSTWVGNNRRKWTVIPVWFLHVHRLTGGAWNSFLNEVWELFVDFNYPPCCWTSLAHVIGNLTLSIVTRTCGSSSLKAVTLVLLFSILSKPASSHLSNTQPQSLERRLPFLPCSVSCDVSPRGRFVSYHVFITRRSTMVV